MKYNALHLSDDSKKKCVVIGLGRVGSWMAFKLAQIGVKRFVLIDGDRVEESNLIPENITPYSEADIGDFKTDALARILLRNFKELEITVFRRYLNTFIRTELINSIFGDAVIILWCLDSRDGLRLMHSPDIMIRRISIFPAMHVGGGGHVVVYIPFKTPCPVHTLGLQSFNQIIESRARDANISPHDVKAVVENASEISNALLFKGIKSPFYMNIFNKSNYLHLEKMLSGRYRKIWLSPQKHPNCFLCGTRLIP